MWCVCGVHPGSHYRYSHDLLHITCDCIGSSDNDPRLGGIYPTYTGKAILMK